MKPPTPSRKNRRVNKSIPKSKKNANLRGTQKNEFENKDGKIIEDGREEKLSK